MLDNIFMKTKDFLFSLPPGTLKKIINKVNEHKIKSQAEKNINIVKEIVKNLKAAKGAGGDSATLTSKQTGEGEEYGRLGDAIARGHKPPCICPDKSESLSFVFFFLHT